MSRAPRASEPPGVVADHDRRPSADRDLARLAVADESEKATVRRPEASGSPPRCPPPGTPAARRGGLTYTMPLLARGESIATNASVRPSGEIFGHRMVRHGCRRLDPRSAAPPGALGRFEHGERRPARPPPAIATAATTHATLLAVPATQRDRRGHAGLRAAFGDPLELELHVVRRLDTLLVGPSPGSDWISRSRAAGISGAMLETGGGSRSMIAADQRSPDSSPSNARLPVAIS